MAEPVLHVLDERFGLAHQSQHLLDDVDVVPLRRGAEVVDLPRLAQLQRGQQAAAVILDVDPVAHVHAVAVDRQGQVANRVGDHERDELLRELVGPVVVGAAGHHHRELEGVEVGQRQQVGGGLRRRVGRRRIERRPLGEEAGGAERAVDLVGGDVQEALHAELAGRLEQHLRAAHVGLDEDGRRQDGPVHVALRGEMHDRVEPLVAEEVGDQFPVADVAAHEAVAGVAGQVGQVLGVAGVGEPVEVHHPPARPLGQDEPDQVGADEAATAGEEDVHRCSSPCSKRRAWASGFPAASLAETSGRRPCSGQTMPTAGSSQARQCSASGW